MKKILISLFALLLLVGCSTKSYTNITDEDKVLFKGPDSVYTKGDLYKVLKVASEDSIETDILNKIANNLQIDYSDVEQEADETIELYKSMGYEEMIISYYGSLEAFKDMYVQSSLMSKLAEVYINENYDKLVKEDKPVSMQVVYFDNQESADNFINDVTNNAKTFETAAIENGYDTECKVSVYLDSDNLPLNVKSYLNATTDTGLSKVIVDDSATDSSNETENKKYYVLNIVSRNVEEFKEDYIDAKINSVSEDYVKNYMFETHDIKFYDQDIYEIMKSAYEVFE